MDWLVLKNRRHEGPFSEDALREAYRAGRFQAEDYALTVAQSERGDFEYTSVRKVLGLPEDSVAAPTPSVPPPRKPVAKKTPTPPPVSVAAKPAPLPVAPVASGSPIVPQSGGRAFPWKLRVGLVLAALGVTMLVVNRPGTESAPVRNVGSVEAPRAAAPRPASPHAEGAPNRAQRATEHVLRVPKISGDDAHVNSNLPPPMNAAYPETATNSDSVAAAAGVGNAPETNAIDVSSSPENDPNAAASAVNVPNAERTIASPPEGQYFQPAYVPTEAQPR